MGNKAKAPRGFKFVEQHRNRGTLKEIDTGYAVRCEKCGNDCTQYHPTKRGALKELKQRGHSSHMCEWFRKDDGYGITND